jgi:hypothetical protein
VLLPMAAAGLLGADGWLDWRGPAAYLATRDSDDPARDTLVWADRTGVRTRGEPGAAVPAGGAPASPSPTPSGLTTTPPPAKPPTGNWRTVTWAEHDAQGSSDLDVPLGAVLAATGTGAGDAAGLRSRASWLRADTLRGVPVTVYEIRGPAESGTAPGQGLLRYWVDRSGLLLRVELRTSANAFGYLDVTSGTLPALTPPR